MQSVLRCALAMFLCGINLAGAQTTPAPVTELRSAPGQEVQSRTENAPWCERRRTPPRSPMGLEEGGLGAHSEAASVGHTHAQDAYRPARHKTLAWRHNIPESYFPAAWIPGLPDFRVFSGKF